MDWRLDDSLESEQLNTLILIDKLFEKYPQGVNPVFHVLGGTALVFHGISSIATIDIDVANRLNDNVKSLVSDFISDNASEVATLPLRYETRLIPFHAESFKHIQVYLLSLEDLAITKLGSFRHKDKEDLVKTNFLQKVDYEKLIHIIHNEFKDEIVKSKILVNLASLE